MTVRLDEILKGIKPYVLGWITGSFSGVAGSGTPGQLAKFIGTQTIGDSLVNEVTGPPVATITVEKAGGSHTSQYIKSVGDHYTAYALKNSGREYWWQLTPTTDAPANRLRLVDGTLTAERLTILTNGNVGIGAANPGAKLHVGGDALVDLGLTVDASAANTGTLTSSLRFGSSASGEGVLSNRAAGTNQYGLDLFTNSTRRLSVTNGGDVGVGTASPGARLHVSGGDVLLDNNQAYRMKDSGGTAQALLKVSAGNRVNFGSLSSIPGGGQVEFYNSGVLGGTLDGNRDWQMEKGVTVDASGANTGALTSALRFGSSASTEGIGSNRAAGTNQNGVDIFTASTRRLSVTSGGNVGIGIATPGAKLHVSAGDVLLDNNQAYRMKDTSGNAQALLKVSAGNRVNFGSLSSIPGGGQVEFYNSGVLGGTLDGNRDWQMEKGVTVDASGGNTGTLTSALRFGSSTSTEGIGSNRSVGGNNANGVDLFTASTRRLSVTSGGNVGVNIYNPSEKLQVAGGNVLIDRSAFYKAKDFSGTARGILGIDADNRVDVGSIEALSYDGSIRFWVQAVVAGRFALTTRRFEASYGADITGDLSLNAGDKASGSGVMAIANRTAAPSGTPSGGGVLYAESGSLKWKGSGGSITTIAPA